MAALRRLETGILAILVTSALACGAEDPVPPVPEVTAPAPRDGDKPAQLPPTLCALLETGAPCRAVDLKAAFQSICRKGAFTGRIVIRDARGSQGEDGAYEIEAGLRLTRHLVRYCGASYGSLVYETTVSDLFERDTIVLYRQDAQGGVGRLLPGLSTKPRGEGTLVAEYATPGGAVTIVVVTGNDGLSLYNAAEIVELGLLP